MAAESNVDNEHNTTRFSPASIDISESEIAKQIQANSKSGDKYSFTYKFKNYVKAKVNFDTQKTSDISVKLVTTSSGGAKNIFYRIYQQKNLTSTYLKQLKFPTDKEVTKTTTLGKGSYTFQISRNPKKYSDNNKNVVGSGYMIIEK